MKYKQHIICLILIFVFSGCYPTYQLESYKAESINVESPADSIILAIIAPYKEGIEGKMSQVLSYTKNDLTKRKPESTIGNFVTDLCLEYADADICVMNNGGLRTSIMKGNITRGKLYELMPFENELVVIELDEESFTGLLEYITKRGGEPFSGMRIIAKEKEYKINGIDGVDNYFASQEIKKIRVLTSDYLANGGDKMKFFKDKKQYKSGIKIRDAIIDYCTRTDTIDVEIDGRIKIQKNAQ